MSTFLSLNGKLEQSAPKTDWKGSWIWVDDRPADRNVYSWFRRSFTTDSLARLAIAITADSFYSLYVDGLFVCCGPARAPLAWYLYDEHLLTIDKGEHVISVLVHHVGEINACMMLGRPGLLVDVYLTIDNHSEDLSTDLSWKCLPADAWRKDLPDKMSHFGFWEECDLSKIPANWKEPIFDDRSWHKPVIIGKPPCAPWKRLIVRDISVPKYSLIEPTSMVAHGTWDKNEPNMTPSKEVASRKRELKADKFSLPFTYKLESDEFGEYITIDFGRTVSGYIEIEFSDCFGQVKMDISYDEMCTLDKAINPERSYAHLTDRYLLAPVPSILRTTHPRGFRYISLDFCGKGLATVSRITAIEELYPFGPVQQLSLSDKTLETYFTKAAQTVRICTTDSFTDCPTRERVQWMEDMYMHAKVAFYAFGDTQMLRHSLFMAAQCALSDGRINGFFPTDRTNLAFASSTISWLHLLADYWLFCGNEDIKKLFPTALRCIEFVDCMSNSEGIVANWPAGQFWDWAPIEDSGCLMLTNAAYVWALVRLAQHQVFRHGLGIDLDDRIEKACTSAHRYFWDDCRKLYKDKLPENGKSTIYSQHANVLAVLSGICPLNERKDLLERIINPKNLGPIPVGEEGLKENNRCKDGRMVPVGTLWFAHFICQALFENKMDNEAIEQIKLFWGEYDNLPTLPETRIQSGNTGHCHGWAAGPAWLLPMYVLGIRPIGKGFSEIEIQPHPGPLSSGSGSIKTSHGTITVCWKREPDKLHIQLDVPENIKVCLLDSEGKTHMVDCNKWNGVIPYSSKSSRDKAYQRRRIPHAERRGAHWHGNFKCG